LNNIVGRDDGADSSVDGAVCSAIRWWSLRDRFSRKDLPTIPDLYGSVIKAKQIVERFGVSERALRGCCTSTAYVVNAAHLRL
jgi:hypothetical protein